MRHSLLVSFLLLSLLISEVQGIRLNKGLLSFGLHKTQDDIAVNKESNGAMSGEDNIHCKEGKCSSGNNRKLIAKAASNPTTTTTTTISKNGKNGGTKGESTSKGKSDTEKLGGKEESFSVTSLRVSNHREAAHEQYPDILDLAGMDYSPAKRKPPIHN